MRQLDAVQDQYKLLSRLGIRVVATSTDPESGARKTAPAGQFGFPVGFGVTATDIDALGAVAGERKGETIMQPAEFILRPGGEIASSLYATTQLGRMNPREIAVFVKNRQ